MSRGVFWWICLVTILVSACGAAVGAVRWLGPPELVRALAPLGHAPLFLGTVGAHVGYALVQGAVPGGREPVWMITPGQDGWVLALVLAQLCAVLASFPVTPGGEPEILLSTPFVLISAFLLVDRMRRVQRRPGQPS